MKRLPLLLALGAALLLVPVAAATTTTTVSGPASMFSYFTYSFSASAGDVDVNASFAAQNNSSYSLLVYRDGVLICNRTADFHGRIKPSRSSPTMIDCLDANGPGGSYEVEFGPNDGSPTTVTLTITTP